MGKRRGGFVVSYQWVAVRHSAVLRCPCLSVLSRRLRAVQGWGQGPAGGVCPCRWDSVGAPRHGRVKEQQQEPSWGGGNGRGRVCSKGGKHVGLPVLMMWCSLHWSLTGVWWKCIRSAPWFVRDCPSSGDPDRAQHLIPAHWQELHHCLCSVPGLLLLSWPLWWPVALSSAPCSVGLAGSPPDLSW